MRKVSLRWISDTAPDRLPNPRPSRTRVAIAGRGGHRRCAKVYCRALEEGDLESGAELSRSKPSQIAAVLL